MIDFLLGVPGKLKTITDYLTTYMAAARMAKIDNCDTTTSSRAPANTAVSSADYTPAKAVFIDTAISGRLGSIKAIYRGTITIAAASGSNTATITAVNTSKSILVNLGSHTTGAADLPAACRLELTNSTTITASKFSVSEALIVGYQVIEFN